MALPGNFTLYSEGINILMKVYCGNILNDAKTSNCFRMGLFSSGESMLFGKHGSCMVCI